MNTYIIYTLIIGIITAIAGVFVAYKHKKDCFDIGIKLVGLISVVIGLISYIDNNERARREAAITIVLNVQDKIGLGTGLYCAKFLSDMSDVELRKLRLIDEEVEIDIEHKDTLNRCLAGQNDLFKPSKTNVNHLLLTRDGSYHVWYQVAHDLNLLELLAVAYYSRIVDKDMIVNTYGLTLKAAPIEGFIGKLRSVGDKQSFQYLEKYIQSKDRDYPLEKRQI